MEKKKRFWITIGCIAGAAAAGYFGTAVYFANHFPYHAAVDGIDVSGMTLEEAGQALAGRTSNYTLTLTGRGGLTDTITAEDIDLSMDMAQGETRRGKLLSFWMILGILLAVVFIALTDFIL